MNMNLCPSMEENGHVGIVTPAMTLEGKGRDERLVWVLSRHKNEEVWLGRIGGARAHATEGQRRMHPSLTRTVVNPVVSARQPARATAPTATDSVRVFFAIRFRIAPPSQSTSAGRAGLSLGAVLRAFATTSLEPRSLASLLPSTLACSSGFIGQAVTCGLWGFSRRSYGPVGTPAETPQRLDEGCSIWTPLVWEGASRYSGPRLPGLCVVLP